MKVAHIAQYSMVARTKKYSSTVLKAIKCTYYWWAGDVMTGYIVHTYLLV